MKNRIEYKTSGTCSRMVIVEIDDGIITDCEFVGGCAGNTKGVAALVKGMKATEAIEKINSKAYKLYWEDVISLAVEFFEEE